MISTFPTSCPFGRFVKILGQQMPRVRKTKSHFAPTFPYKLWELVENSEDETIRWNDDGSSITINTAKFTSRHLQSDDSIFKTSIWSSFVRQLNYYGFKKIVNDRHCCLCHLYNSVEVVFHHPHFQRGHIDDLQFIRRSVNKTKHRGQENATCILQQTVDEVFGADALGMNIDVLENGDPGSGAEVWLLPEAEDLPAGDGQWIAVAVDVPDQMDLSEFK